MDISLTLARSIGMTPFDMLNQRTDDVIMIINYYVEKGEDAPADEISTKKTRTGETRVRVDDRTATGGWF